MRRVGIVRSSIHVGCDDVGIELLVMLGKAVGGGLCRCCLKVVELAVVLDLIL